jgi:CYTH domain-containing protein
MKKTKIVISMVLVSFAIMLSLFAVNARSSTTTTDNTDKGLVVGDINGDGKTDSIDFGEIRNYLLGVVKDFSYIHGLEAADVNGDGDVDIIDYGIYRKYLLGIITEFPRKPTPTPTITVKPTSTQVEGLEIERKFLIEAKNIPYDLKTLDTYEITQSYINFSPEIRLRNVDNRMFYLTIKASVDYRGMVREERNFWITEEEYYNLYKKVEGNTIYKTRYQGPDEHGNTFAIDIFKGDLEGLAYYEMEFKNEELANDYTPPSWVGKEVTSDNRYKNGSLAQFGIPKD